MPLYAVTGGAGFIGSHLCDALLAAGYAVRVLDDLSTGRRENLPPQAELHVGDVADPHAVRRLLDGAVGCFHLAAIASVQRGNEDWIGTHRANQTGSVTVFDAARAARLPVVYASSAAIYGDAGAGAVAEDHMPRPRTAYGADKLGSELHAAVATGVHGIPTAGLRFFNVYGPRQDPSSPYSGVISIFADRAARGVPVQVHGDGRQSRDFIHVRDVVAHLFAAMTRLEAGAGPLVLNVCTGRSTSILELAELLGAAWRLEPGSARAGDIRCSLGNPARAAAELGVRATVTLADGLRTLRTPAVAR